MAAGYTLRELMEYMGHSSLQATERYVKLLPTPAGPDGAADRLNAYLACFRKAVSASRCEHVANNCQRQQRFVAVRCGSPRPRRTTFSLQIGAFAAEQRCRRRDSNPRHADYDSAALTD